MTRTTAPIVRGALVRYRGNADPAGNRRSVYFVLSALPGDRFDIADQEFPWFRLCGVRRASITPLGRSVRLCACGHDMLSVREDGCCFDCGCFRHTDVHQPVAGEPFVISQQVPDRGVFLHRYRWECLGCGLIDLGLHLYPTAAEDTGVRVHTACRPAAGRPV